MGNTRIFGNNKLIKYIESALDYIDNTIEEMRVLEDADSIMSVMESISKRIRVAENYFMKIDKDWVNKDKMFALREKFADVTDKYNNVKNELVAKGIPGVSIVYLDAEKKEYRSFFDGGTEDKTSHDLKLDTHLIDLDVHFKSAESYLTNQGSLIRMNRVKDVLTLGGLFVGAGAAIANPIIGSRYGAVSAEYRNLENEYGSLENTNINLENEIKLLRDDKLKLRDKVKELTDQLQNATSPEELNRLLGRIQELENTLKGVENWENKYNSLNNEHNELLKQVSTLREELDAKSGIIEDLNSRLKEADIEIEKYDKEIAALEKQLSEALAGNDDALIKELRAELEQAKKDKDDVIKEVKELEKQLNEEKVNNEKSIKDLKDQLKAAQDKLKTLENQIKDTVTKAEHEALVAIHNDLKSEYDELNTKYAGVFSENKMLKDQNKALTGDKTNLTSQVNNLRTQITELNNEITGLNSEIKRLNALISTNQAELDAARKEIKNLKETISQMESSGSGSAAEIKELKEKLATAEKRANTLQAQIDKMIVDNNANVKKLEDSINTWKSKYDSVQRENEELKQLVAEGKKLTESINSMYKHIFKDEGAGLTAEQKLQKIAEYVHKQDQETEMTKEKIVDFLYDYYQTNGYNIPREFLSSLPEVVLNTLRHNPGFIGNYVEPGDTPSNGSVNESTQQVDSGSGTTGKQNGDSGDHGFVNG